jgi:pilus assembly protein CpaB
VSSRRTAILIGAIAIGVVAVLLIVSYVNGIEERVNNDAEAQSAFVAKNPIKRGTEGGVAVSDGSIEATTVPRKFYPATAIQSTDAVQKKVALFDIAPGTIIVDGMFVDPATTQISFRQRLEKKTYVAISISVDQVRGVGGFLVPGDEINMMVIQDNTNLKNEIETPKGAADATKSLIAPPDLKPALTTLDIDNYTKGGPQWIVLNKTARYMWQKVKVIAVGSNTLLTAGEQAQTTSANGQPTQSTNTGLLTLQVPADAAQWIASGQEAGYYLSLVPKDYTPSAKLQALPVVINQFPGEDPGKLTPYYADPQG